MTECTECGKKVGRLEGLQLRVVKRVFRRAEKRFKVNLNSGKYGGICKMCLLIQADTRLMVLTTELQVEAELAGKSAKDYGQEKIKEMKSWIEKESGRAARKTTRVRGGFRK